MISYELTSPHELYFRQLYSKKISLLDEYIKEGLEEIIRLYYYYYYYYYYYSSTNIWTPKVLLLLLLLILEERVPCDIENVDIDVEVVEGAIQ